MIFNRPTGQRREAYPLPLATIVPNVVEKIGRRTIVYHLARASCSTGAEAQEAFRIADHIRCRLERAA